MYSREGDRDIEAVYTELQCRVNITVGQADQHTGLKCCRIDGEHTHSGVIT